METIKIKKLGRKQMPSKYREGQTYAMTQIIDAQNRKMTGFGPWTENWKIEDEISANITKSDFTDRNGITKTSLKLENPNPSSQQRGQQYDTNRIPYVDRLGWEIASKLAPILFSGQKGVKLSDIEKLVIAIKSKLDPSKESVPEIDIHQEDTTSEVKVTDVKLDNDLGDENELPF